MVNKAIYRSHFNNPNQPVKRQGWPETFQNRFFSNAVLILSGQ